MPSLAEIILAGGQQRANTALRLADIEAERRTRNAAVWAGTANSLGQIGAQTIQTLGNAPLVKARAASEQADADFKRMQMEDFKTQQSASRAAQATTAARAAIIDAAWTKTPDGMWTLDQNKLVEGHRAAGLAYDPVAIKPYLDSIDKANEVAHTARTAYFGELAKFVSASGNSLESFTHAVDAAVRNNYVDPTQAAGLIKRATANPQVIPQIVDALTGKPPEKPVVVGKDARLVDPVTGAVRVDAVPDVPKPDVPIIRVNPTTGKTEQVGTAPAGSHFVQPPASTQVTVAPPPPELSVDSDSQNILSQTGLSINAFRLLTGNASQLSRDAATRKAAAEEAQKWARAHNVDIATLPAQYKTYNDVLSANIARLNNTKIMEGELQGTIENLRSVAKDADLGNLKVANVLKIWAGQEVNDSLAQQYALHLGQLRNELSAYYAATQGRTGNNITLQDQRDAELVLKNGLASKSLDGLKTAIENSTAKMGTVMQGSVDRTRKAVWDLFGVGANYGKGGNKDPMGIRR